MADDIYPLGQDNGLLADIINFGLNNLYQYGQRTKASNQQLSQGMSEIAAGGSPDMSPLIRDAMAVNPLTAGTFGPIRTAAQKQAVRALWRADPDAVKAIASDPRQLNITVPEVSLAGARVASQSGVVPTDALGVFSPSTGIRIAPMTMRGSVYQPEVAGSLWWSPSQKTIAQREAIRTMPGGMANLPETMLHEATHFLNVPRIYDTMSRFGNDAFDMYNSIAPYISQSSRKAAINAGKQALDPRIALDEALAYLSSPGTRSPLMEDVGKSLQDTLKMRPAAGGGTRGVRLSPENINTAITNASSNTTITDLINQTLNRLLGK